MKKLKNFNIKFFISITKTDNYYVIDRSFGEKSLEIKNQIKKFGDTLANNFDESETENFRRNLASLYIEKKEDLTHPNATGEYSVLKNIIYIRNNVGLTLYHELFHMAASKDEESGFERYVNGTIYNRGLNEGCTDLLTYKYFDDKETAPGYFIETALCAMLDDLFGEGKLEKYYLNCDIDGFMNELCKYLEEGKAFDLLDIIDTLYDQFDCGDYDPNTIDESLKQAYIYLTEAYINKMHLEYKNDRLSKTTAKLMALNFMDKWDGTITYDGNNYDLTNDNIKNDIAKKKIYTI